MAEGVTALVLCPVMEGIYTHTHPMEKLDISALDFAKGITI